MAQIEVYTPPPTPATVTLTLDTNEAQAVLIALRAYWPSADDNPEVGYTSFKAAGTRVREVLAAAKRESGWS